MHPAELPIPELLRQCEVVHTRRSGPGGQHRNKVETAKWEKVIREAKIEPQ